MIPPALLPLAAFFLPLFLAWLLTWLLLRWAPRLGLVDYPAARKVHTQPTPRGGGLAIYVAAALTAGLLASHFPSDLFVTLGVGFVVMVLGLADDLRPLPWQLRLGVQGLCAVGMVAYGLPGDPGWLWRLLAVFWIVGLVNAFNMLDNMDALSAGVAWIAAAAFALAPLVREASLSPWQAALPWLLLMGACSGFLWFNRPPARIFMGDAGSTFLGFFIGVRSLEGVFANGAVSPAWPVPLCILAVPWYDLTAVITLRLWQGKSPFHADKQHVSHRLVYLGLSSPAAVGTIYLFGVGSGLAGLALLQAHPLGRVLIGAQLVIWWLAIAAVEYVRHYRQPSKKS
jgi:UDP-GlcNAc:undecaprenyl-phosphate GlcNAc-1-phosphate transferase